MKKIIIIALMMSFIGCASLSKSLQSALAPAAGIGDNITCESGCKDEWARAQLWIVNHSKWKIQMATDVMIQTFNPIRHEVSYGFTVTKEPTGSDSYIIQMNLACGNPLGCDPRPIDVRNAFYYYVKTGVDLLQGKGYLGSIR